MYVYITELWLRVLENQDWKANHWNFNKRKRKPNLFLLHKIYIPDFSFLKKKKKDLESEEKERNEWMKKFKRKEKVKVKAKSLYSLLRQSGCYVVWGSDD